MMSRSAICPLALRFLGRHLDWATGCLPGSKAASDMRDRGKTHALSRLSCQRRALACRAEEYKLLVLGENVLVILAFGINPEFQHSARTVESARHAPLALELANIAQVHKDHITATVQRHGVTGREALDLPFGGLDQGAH